MYYICSINSIIIEINKKKSKYVVQYKNLGTSLIQFHCCFYISLDYNLMIFVKNCNLIINEFPENSMSL